jgi:translation initiation factor IF-2
MSNTTVSEFASELKKPVETLLEQLKGAGVPKEAAGDVLTDSDKQKLLSFLQISHGTAGAGERKKITLTKKSTTEIKQADATGKARTIQVEVRKKRTFVQRDEEVAAEPVAPPPPPAPTPAAPAAPVIDDAEQARRDEEARRQAEFNQRLAQEADERRKAAEAARAKQQDKPEPQEPAAPVSEQNEPAAGVESAPAAPEVVAPSMSAEEVAADSADRRRKALAEAEAIRAMMSAPKKVLVAKRADEPKPAAKEGVKGTLHKPAAGAKKADGTPVSSPTAGPGAKKTEVKSEKLSSSWGKDADGKKKGEIKTRGDATGGVGRNNWRGGPRGKRGRDEREEAAPAAPVEARVLEIHVPETITVAELAHKMAVKSSEVIMKLMKLGQMVTINQSLDQDTAMILVEELGHKALAATLESRSVYRRRSR